MSISKYQGIIPAFYATYDKKGEVAPERTQELAQYFINSNVKGLYVCGSSGECVYQSVSERKTTLENVMKVAQDKLTIIAHVACNNTKDSIELAKHAESLGVDAIAAIPPIYFKLSETAVIKYWNDISNAASNTDFFIYNIPQLAGTTLTPSMLKTLLENPLVMGVKNSSMPALDIQQFKKTVGRDKVIFNGPDEQLVSGLIAGADGGIGGTYGVCPKLYVAIYNATLNGDLKKATELQNLAIDLIENLCSGNGHMYALIKEIIKLRTNIDCGGVRNPLINITPSDIQIIKQTNSMIDDILKKI